MAPALCLVGPPELHQPKKPPTTPISTYEDLPVCKDLKSSLPPLNPLLEFFFKAVSHTETPPPPPETPKCGYYWLSAPPKPKELTDYEEEAWKLDSLTTLKTIVCLRMMEKPNKEAFYKSLLWVHKNHPKTLALNVMVLGALGWFDDLRRISNYRSNRLGYDYEEESDDDDDDEKKTKAAAEIAPKDDIAKARIAVERYQNDSDYRFLHDRISDLFAEVLKSDLRLLASGAIKSISFASKFCPSIDSPYDYETLICESIAKKMFPRNNHIEYKYVEDPYYTYRVRNRLGDQVLIPLREAIEKVKKPSIETGKALIALETYRKIFGAESKEEGGSIVLFHHCMKLIEFFSPKENMVGMFGNLSIGDCSKKLPHQIVVSLFKKEKVKGRGPRGDEAAELEWKGLLQELTNQGKLRNCVTVCDMRSSMTGTFKEATCISMGLLISELSENPWKGKIFSFNEFPKLNKVEGDDLRSKCEFMRQMECTEKVNFGAIYNRILQIALTEKLSKEQMPKRIFVFTYSDFVAASKNNWDEEYREAWASYRKRGFSTVPQMVFWNLRDPVAEPEVFGSPVKNQNGGMIMTGFSNLLLQLFFRGETDSRTNAGRSHSFYRGVNVLSVMKYVPNVEDVMNCAISREELENLIVLD
ncbi:uncharacterized protein LOC133737122 [Rosa rugosa]|uniref:uncharacterized protein LOC133737122 n=1 Tax=Rosa rugosa TaxID=74645 RepID=UPI002B401F99|nr:uncharacterized protein LOC133737122 [Rosa rugosa]